jgi:DNA-binding NarL/FixJ family response regulator
MGISNSQIARSGADVYLLAENRLLRETLARLLQKRAGMCVVGIRAATDSAIEAILESHCEVVLTDCLTTCQGTSLIRELLERLPRLRIVLFGMDEDPNAFWQSACLGVSGYLLKNASASEIIAAVRAVSQGEAACPPRLCMSLIQRLAQQSRMLATTESVPGAKAYLTHRQLELVDLVGKGLTNKQIAASLNLSEFTVKNHIRRIMKQVDAGNRHEAVEMVRAHRTAATT